MASTKKAWCECGREERKGKEGGSTEGGRSRVRRRKEKKEMVEGSKKEVWRGGRGKERERMEANCTFLLY